MSHRLPKTLSVSAAPTDRRRHHPPSTSPQHPASGTHLQAAVLGKGSSKQRQLTPNAAWSPAQGINYFFVRPGEPCILWDQHGRKAGNIGACLAAKCRSMPPPRATSSPHSPTSPGLRLTPRALSPRVARWQLLRGREARTEPLLQAQGLPVAAGGPLSASGACFLGQYNRSHEVRCGAAQQRRGAAGPAGPVCAVSVMGEPLGGWGRTAA